MSKSSKLEYMRKYYAENSEKIKEKRAKYRAENKEAIRAAHAKYREENKEAIRAARAKYYAENKEAIKATTSKYYAENKEALKASRAKYYAENKEALKAFQAKYYAENKEAIKAAVAKYYTENKEAVNAYRAKYKKARMKSNPIFKTACLMRSRTRSALRSKNFKKKHSLSEYLGCTIEHLKTYLESKFQPGMTWENQGQWHIDHIIPLASADSVEEVYRLCYYRNLQPLWAADNISKGARQK